MYDTKLMQIPQPAPGGTRYVLVNPAAKSGTEITEVELNRRISSQDFKDWDGQTLVSFAKEKEGRTEISAVEVDAKTTYSEMRYTLAAGFVTPKYSLGLLLEARHIFPACSGRISKPVR